MPRRNTPEDFWKRVRREHPGKCWPWIGPVTDRGYGKTHYAGREARAHQVAFFLTHGYWAFPLVMHSCDKPACCNPAHLKEGSWADNSADMAKKGRAWRPKNELHPACKLSDAQVVELRRLHPSLNYAQLGKRFGIHPTTAGQIIRGVRRAL